MKIGNSFTKIFQPALNSKWIQRLQQMADDFLDSNFKQYECADIREIGDPVLAACVYELLRYQYSNKFDLTPKEMAEKIVIYALAITMESVSRKSNFGLKPPSLDNIFSVERILGYRKIRPEFIDLIIISSVLDLDKTLKYGAKRTAGLKISTSFLPLLQYSNTPTLRN